MNRLNLHRHWPKLSRLLFLAAIGLFPFASEVRGAGAEQAGWLGPVAVAISADGRCLFVALADAKQIAAVDVLLAKKTVKVDVPGEPTSLTVDARTGRLYVTCAGPQSVVCAIDPATMKLVQSIPVGHTATGLAITPDGSQLFVGNRFNNDVSVLSLPEGKEIGRIKLAREPVGLAATLDGKTVFAIDLLPDGPADRDASAARVTAIDAKDLTIVGIRLPNGSSSVRGICIAPDGRHVFVTHVLSRNTLPATQLERGWMNTNALSIFDAREKKLVGTVLLDEVDLGAANPWGVACSPDGATLCVAHAGTHEVSVLDLKAVFAKLAERAESLRTTTKLPAPVRPEPTGNRASKWKMSVVSMPLEPANDLGFLHGLRRRVPLPGNGPRGLAIAGGKAYAAMYFSDALAVIDLSQPLASASATTIPLGPPPRMTEARRGDMLFHDATLCFEHWQSCATCHPDARTDALSWDLMNDGYGNPKNTKSMLLAHRTPPAMSESVRESAEAAVRAGFQNILFRQCSESDAQAVDAYLKSLEAVPSPHLANGDLSPAAQRGKALFFSKRVGCAECHPAPLFTDLKPHNVGTRRTCDHTADFDTPTLVESWRTAPYLHDGSCRTIEDVIRHGKHGKAGGVATELSTQEIADLVEFVLSL
jgi:DNA-binding beta-propeller fold protein YncE